MFVHLYAHCRRWFVVCVCAQIVQHYVDREKIWISKMIGDRWKSEEFQLSLLILVRMCRPYVMCGEQSLD